MYVSSYLLLFVVFWFVNLQDKDPGRLVMGPAWDYNEAYGLCCGYPISGYMRNGVSSGLSGGSAISPEGWRFNICQEPRRCQRDPIDGVSQWYRKMWEVRTSIFAQLVRPFRR